MTRRCSHCSINGHNSRTCTSRGDGSGGGGGLKLFGVQLTEGVGAMKKSASMGNLSSEAAGSPCRPGYPSYDPIRDHAAAASGYASDDPGHASCLSNCRNERKKGIPWIEEEHRMFLLGLQKLGKGDWRGIARNFVVSRTPTQVASHAQKYFIRQGNASRRKRRSSLFDMVPKMPMDHVPALDDLHSPQNEPENSNKLHPSLYLGYGQEPQLIEMAENHEVLKPTPVLRKDLAIPDELVSMSKLSIGDRVANRMEPSALSIKLLETTASRQSAFHVNPSIPRPDVSQNSSNVIHAV